VARVLRYSTQDFWHGHWPLQGNFVHERIVHSADDFADHDDFRVQHYRNRYSLPQEEGEVNLP
jgi:hypothetical protein